MMTRFIKKLLDYWSAKILDETSIDCILVGDSVSVIMHGFDSKVFKKISGYKPLN
jgi:ketopantoate hydroxymethyltransferase